MTLKTRVDRGDKYRVNWGSSLSLEKTIKHLFWIKTSNPLQAKTHPYKCLVADTLHQQCLHQTSSPAETCTRETFHIRILKKHLQNYLLLHDTCNANNNYTNSFQIVLGRLNLDLIIFKLTGFFACFLVAIKGFRNNTLQIGNHIRESTPHHHSPPCAHNSQLKYSKV